MQVTQLAAGQAAPVTQQQAFVVVPQSQQQQQPQNQQCCSKNGMIAVGSMQIAMGLLAIGFNAAAIGVEAALAVASHGFYSGICFILAGVFLILAAKSKSGRCMLISSLVFAIISAVFCLPMFILGAIGIPLDKDNERYARYRVDRYYDNLHNYNNNNNNQYWYQPSYPKDDPDSYGIRYAMNAVIIGIAIVEGILAIIASVYGCKGLCCRGASQPVPHQVQYIANPNQPGQQLVVLTPVNAMGQQMVNPNQIQPQLQYVNPTMQQGQQVVPMGQFQGQVVQPGFTAPVLTTAGAPPAYTYITASAAAPAVPRQQQPPEGTKSGVPQ